LARSTPNGSQRRRQQLPRAATKGRPFPILVLPGGLPDDHRGGVAVGPGPEDHLVRVGGRGRTWGGQSSTSVRNDWNPAGQLSPHS
jgi:hypothetical protein